MSGYVHTPLAWQRVCPAMRSHLCLACDFGGAYKSAATGGTEDIRVKRESGEEKWELQVERAAREAQQARRNQIRTRLLEEASVICCTLSVAGSVMGGLGELSRKFDAVRHGIVA